MRKLRKIVEKAVQTTILVKSIWYTLNICFVFIIAPCSIIKAALFPKLGPPPSPHTMLLQGGQKRSSVPLLLTRIVAPRSRRVLLRVLFCFVPLLIRCERKYLKDNKDNKLLLASEICTNSCPWTLSVPRSSQLPSSFALGQLFASQNR